MNLKTPINLNKFVKYWILIWCLFSIYSCKICKKRVSREIVEIEKRNLVCSCKELKKDSILGKKMIDLEKSSSRYLIGAVLTNKNGRGIYQYIKTGIGVEGNSFMYFNGSNVFLIKKDNLDTFPDSLCKIGIKEKKIDRIIPKIRKSINVPSRNTTDSF